MKMLVDGDCVSCETCIRCGRGDSYEVEACSVCGILSHDMWVDGLNDVICEDCIREYVQTNFSDFIQELGYKVV